MSTQLDFTVGIGKETTYGTPVAPTRFFESEAKMKLDIKRVEGKGLRPTKGVKRLNRSSIASYAVSGEQSVEALSNGLGFLLNAVLGNVTSTTIPTLVPPMFNQIHTLSKTDPVSSYTIQEVLPTLGGTGQGVHVFSGCVADTLDIDAKEGGTVDIKVGWLGRDVVHGGTPAAASYPASDSMFTFVHGSIQHGGTLTVPGTTALGSLSGAAILAANITDFSLSLKRNLDTGGYNLGGAGKRSRANMLGPIDISGKITAEFSDEILRTAFTSQTPMPIVLTFTSDVQVSVGTGSMAFYPVLQIVLPSVLLKGELPTSNGGKPITLSIDFDAFDNGVAAEPIYIVYRSTDITP